MSAHSDILLVGIPDAYVRLLTKAVRSRSKVTVLASLSVIPHGVPPNDAIIAVADEETDGVSEQVRQLRLNHFVWNPVVVLCLQGTDDSDADEWALWMHPLPPDLQQLLALLPTLEPVNEGRRREILGASLITLWEDLFHLSQAAQGRTHLDADDFRKLAQETLVAVESDPRALALEAVESLRSHLRAIMTLPVADVAVLREASRKAADADTAAREASARALVPTRSYLHRMSNALRFLIWGRSLGNRVGRMQAVLEHAPVDLAEKLSPGMGAALTKLRRALVPTLARLAVDPESVRTEAVSSVLEGAQDVLSVFASHIGKLREAAFSAYAGEIGRIVVVEDEAIWREAIVGLLEGMGLPIPVETAPDAASASKLLSLSEVGTLALMDLGLPLDAQKAQRGLIDPEAGLRLVREFSGRGSRVRFVVLTGAQNFADAVRTALAAGVEPADYIHKDPDSWEDQVRSRLHTALLPASPRLPAVHVFRCTARLVSIDGVEVALERKPYAVFEYLAERARRWSPVTQMRSALTSPPRDITPAMSPEQTARCERGETPWPSAFDLLSENRIQDLIYDIRGTIDQAFRGVGRAQQIPEMVAYDSDLHAYRLEAVVELHDRFEELRVSRIEHRVLIVEDAEDWSDAVAKELGALGFQTARARSLEEAQEALESDPPDLVTLDLQLPRDAEELAAGKAHEDNGIAVLQLVNRRFPEIRTAVMTSIAWRDDVMLRILRQGVNIADYVSKQWPSPIERLARSLWRLSLEAERRMRIPDVDDLPKLHGIGTDPGRPDTFHLDDLEVRLSPGPAKLFNLLVQSPNAPMDRQLLVDSVWDAEELPEDFEGALNTLVARLRREITKATGDGVPGRDIVRTKDGVYWLQGVIR